MTHAIIFQPTKSAPQSGLKHTKKWVLRYEPVKPQSPDQLIGWSGGGSTQQQICLKFDRLDQAIAYAQHQKIPFEVKDQHKPSFKSKSYAANFT